MTTVMIVDDHPEFRARARRLLQDGGFAVVGEAADGESALAVAAATRPQAVLLDIQLPGISGFEVSQLLAAETQAPSVVLVSSREASDYGSRIEQCGACGFISKGDLTVQGFSVLLEKLS